MVRMDIQTVVVGGGPVSSLIMLKPHDENPDMPMKLPIRIGNVEASAISLGIDSTPKGRPITHDLLVNTIRALNADIGSVSIVKVEGTTFYAQVNLVAYDGHTVSLDARPSDALALAVRTAAPIYADEKVLETAGLPDFEAVEEDERQEELKEFHDFVENLSPEDFDQQPSKDSGSQAGEASH